MDGWRISSREWSRTHVLTHRLSDGRIAAGRRHDGLGVGAGRDGRRRAGKRHRDGGTRLPVHGMRGVPGRLLLVEPHDDGRLAGLPVVPARVRGYLCRARDSIRVRRRRGDQYAASSHVADTAAAGRYVQIHGPRRIRPDLRSGKIRRPAARIVAGARRTLVRRVWQRESVDWGADSRGVSGVASPAAV